MLGIGSSELILSAIVVLLLLVCMAAGVAIVYSMYRHYAGKRVAGLEARVEALEKRLNELQK